MRSEHHHDPVYKRYDAGLGRPVRVRLQAPQARRRPLRRRQPPEDPPRRRTCVRGREAGHRGAAPALPPRAPLQRRRRLPARGLDRNDLRFDTVVSSEQAGAIKPNPAIFGYAAGASASRRSRSSTSATTRSRTSSGPSTPACRPPGSTAPTSAVPPDPRAHAPPAIAVGACCRCWCPESSATSPPKTQSVRRCVPSGPSVDTIDDVTDHDRSRDLFARAQQLMPGGVNSPVRAFRAVGGDPPVIAYGAGARLVDVDGNEYIDYVCSCGPLILGHAHPAVVAVHRRAPPSAAPPSARRRELEVELARLVCEAVPSIEMVRFVNSGTEATMSALRLARAFTGRPKILKFEGGYHGHADGLLVQAGSGVATLGLPDSPGVPAVLRRRDARRARTTTSTPSATLFDAARRRDRRRHRRAGRRQHGRRPAAAGLPRRPARAHARRTARCSSSTRSSPASALGLGGAQDALRRHAGPHLPGQDHRRRPARRRLRRPARDHGDGRARSAPSTRPARSPATRWRWPPASPR